MNKRVVMMFGFAFVMVAGVVVVLVSEKSEEEVSAEIFMLSSFRLSQQGQQICQNEIERALGEKVYSPTRCNRWSGFNRVADLGG
ncbi:MAG: hypothetical protein ACRERU_16225 [Methylococcales bacterium]